MSAFCCPSKLFRACFGFVLGLFLNSCRIACRLTPDLFVLFKMFPDLSGSTIVSPSLFLLPSSFRHCVLSGLLLRIPFPPCLFLVKPSVSILHLVLSMFGIFILGLHPSLRKQFCRTTSCLINLLVDATLCKIGKPHQRMASMISGSGSPRNSSIPKRNCFSHTPNTPSLAPQTSRVSHRGTIGGNGGCRGYGDAERGSGTNAPCAYSRNPEGHAPQRYSRVR